MRHNPRGACLCNRCCERARVNGPQYAQQYRIGSFGNGLGHHVPGSQPIESAAVRRAHRPSDLLPD